MTTEPNQVERGPACQAVAAMWDGTVASFLEGGPAVPQPLRRWAAAYKGTGRGEVELDAFPEPFLGALEMPAGVLALNPGRADLAFQGRQSIFADEIRAAGSYSAWAISWPYLRNPWIAQRGRNPHHSNRLAFLRTWTGKPDLSSAAMVGFELYPWHSTAVTATMRPDPKIIEEQVWKPVAELGAPVFAFGAPWFPILESGLGLRVVDRLGAGGRPYPTQVGSRSVAVMINDDGLVVIAEKHTGSAGPPSAREAVLLREAIDRWLA